MRTYINILFFLSSFIVYGQLQTSGGMSATQLVQDVLLGEGVEVFNITYSGANQAIGYFNASNAVLGIDEGILITTGTIQSGPDGPYGPNNKPDAGLDNGKGGYGALSNLVGGKPTFNAAVLEFDFIPSSDTVSFKYVFASEEYPEYVGSDFNDVFAFFISGPGIPGGSKNMAIIPGTSQPVTINNVNHLSNSSHYQNNGDGQQAPYNSNPQYIQYDGFTKPLVAFSEVECGEVYHLVIAIADVSDPVWDSGIFLEKNSLNSEQPVRVSFELTSDPYLDGQTMAQNCTSAIVTITRSGTKINEPLTIPINVSGSAIEGLDYSTIPNSITFAAGQAEVSFTIDALNNTNLVDVVNIFLEFEILDACNNEEFQTLELFIKPVEPLSIVLEDQALMCVGEPLELIPVVTGGGGEYYFQWSTGETTPSITVTPESTTSYSVSVTDECLNETVSTTVVVTIPVYDPLVLQVSDDVFEDCPYIENILSVSASGGAGFYTYQWTDPNGNIIGNSEEVEVTPGATTTYYITVTDYCGEVATDFVTAHVLSPPLTLEITPEQLICPGDSVEIVVEATGGFGDYYYYWVETGDTTTSIWVNPMENTVYHVIVKDDCQTFQVSASTLVKVIKPKADFTIHGDTDFVDLPVTFQNQTVNGNAYHWDFGDGTTSGMVHPNNTYHEPGDYIITLIATDRYGCVDSIQKPIRILEEFYMYVPNSFTPDGNMYNNTFSISTIGVEQFEILIFSRWGELLFEAKDANFEWDGTYGGVLVPDGTYIWKMKYSTVNNPTGESIKVGHVNVLR